MTRSPSSDRRCQSSPGRRTPHSVRGHDTECVGIAVDQGFGNPDLSLSIHAVSLLSLEFAQGRTRLGAQRSKMSATNSGKRLRYLLRVQCIGEPRILPEAKLAGPGVPSSGHPSPHWDMPATRSRSLVFNRLLYPLTIEVGQPFPDPSKGAAYWGHSSAQPPISRLMDSKG